MFIPCDLFYVNCIPVLFIGCNYFIQHSIYSSFYGGTKRINKIYFHIIIYFGEVMVTLKMQSM